LLQAADNGLEGNNLLTLARVERGKIFGVFG